MTKTKRSITDLKKSPEFQEELLMLKAQTVIYELLEHCGFDQSKLAKKLGQSEAHVSALLSGKRNMTLRTLARICYFLDSKINLQASPLSQSSEAVYVPLSGFDRGVVLPHVSPYRAAAPTITDLQEVNMRLESRYVVNARG